MFRFEVFVLRLASFFHFISLLFSSGCALHKMNCLTRAYTFNVVIVIIIIVNIIIKYQITTWFVLVILLVSVPFSAFIVCALCTVHSVHQMYIQYGWHIYIFVCWCENVCWVGPLIDVSNSIVIIIPLNRTRFKCVCGSLSVHSAVIVCSISWISLY